LWLQQRCLGLRLRANILRSLLGTDFLLTRRFMVPVSLPIVTSIALLPVAAIAIVPLIPSLAKRRFVPEPVFLAPLIIDKIAGLIDGSARTLLVAFCIAESKVYFTERFVDRRSGGLRRRPDVLLGPVVRPPVAPFPILIPLISFTVPRGCCRGCDVDFFLPFCTRASDYRNKRYTLHDEKNAKG